MLQSLSLQMDYKWYACEENKISETTFDSILRQRLLCIESIVKTYMTLKQLENPDKHEPVQI